MIVCAHGDVTEFCKKHDMSIGDTGTGDLREYSGYCRVLVTDSDISESEYYFLKGEFLAKGIELVSTRYKDDVLMSEYLTYVTARRKSRNGGRRLFSDPAVIQKILELRSAGLSLRAIQEDDEVRHDGKKLSLSTIKKIIEREG